MTLSMDADDAPAKINAYLLERIRKTEAENTMLRDRVSKLEAFLEQWRQSFIDNANEAGEYFSLMDGEGNGS